MLKLKGKIYTRVSTDRQSCENQVRQLKEMARRMNIEVVQVIEEVKSSRKQRMKLNTLMKQNGFDVLLIWSLDRLSRGGLTETIMHLNTFFSRGIKVISHEESWLNSNDELTRNILIAVFSSLAKVERDRISKRVKAGLETARSNGKKIGRPERSVSEDRLEKIRELRETGIGYGMIGKQVRLTKSMVQYLCKKHNININIDNNNIKQAPSGKVK